MAGRACARAAPDGYTVCNVDNEIISNPDFLFKDVGYNSQKDFAPITNGYFIINGFVAARSLNVKTLTELIAFSKSRPEGINVGSPATSLTMFIDPFAKHTGANFHVIPFKSGGEVAAALLTNTIQSAAIGLGNLMPYFKDGSIKPLSVDSAKRFSLLPDVPTLKELGYDSLRIKSWYGFVVPTGTPEDIIKFLHDSSSGSTIARIFTRSSSSIQRSSRYSTLQKSSRSFWSSIASVLRHRRRNSALNHSDGAKGLERTPRKRLCSKRQSYQLARHFRRTFASA